MSVLLTVTRPTDFLLTSEHQIRERAVYSFTELSKSVLNPESCIYSWKTIRALFRIKTLDAYCSPQSFLFCLFLHLFPFTLSEVKFIYVSALLFSILPSGRAGFFFIALTLLCPEVLKLFIKETNLLLCSFEQMC